MCVNAEECIGTHTHTQTHRVHTVCLLDLAKLVSFGVGHYHSHFYVLLGNIRGDVFIKMKAMLH